MSFWDAFWATLGIIAALAFLIILIVVVALVLLVLAEIVIRFQQWWISRRNQTP